MTRLKVGSVVFAVLGIVLMILWSGEFDPANIIILAACGCIGGTPWYLGMRWFFRHFGLLPANGRALDPRDQP